MHKITKSQKKIKKRKIYSKYMSSIYFAAILSIVIFGIGLYGGILIGARPSTISFLNIHTGVFILFISILLFVSAYSVLQQRRYGILVKSGVYEYIRHPRYVSFMLIFLGVSILFNSITALLASIVNIILWHWVASNKDKDLIKKFGDDYIKYMSKVPAYIPIGALRKNWKRR